MNLPSKELLSAVLGLEIVGINQVANRIEYTTSLFPSNTSHVNIYELMHMIKEWAYVQNKDIRSGVGLGVGYAHIFIGGIIHEIDFFDNSEFEAVTKACEWILEQQK